MHVKYSDILEKLGEPKWWDEHAVPRYCDFSPDEIADIYAVECVFLLISCQACGYEYKVVISNDGFDWRGKSMKYKDRIEEVGYGDPPYYCCHAGATMTSNAIRVLEFWEKNKNSNYEWVRNHELEILLPEGRSLGYE